MTSRTMALCHPSPSWRRGQWSGSTSLINLLGERESSQSLIVGWLVSECLLNSFCPPTIPSLLWLYLRARHGRDGHSYCSVKGCERVKITASMSTKQTCNCTAKAYPKYSKSPSHVVPMPPLNNQPCKGCGAKQVWVASFTNFLFVA